MPSMIKFPVRPLQVSMQQFQLEPENLVLSNPLHRILAILMVNLRKILSYDLIHLGRISVKFVRCCILTLRMRVYLQVSLYGYLVVCQQHSVSDPRVQCKVP